MRRSTRSRLSAGEHRSHWRRALQLTAALSAISTGCSFGADADVSEHNICSIDSDCGMGHCEAGRCVTGTESPLSVALIVTPKHMPDGSQPVPIVSAPFALHAGKQMFSLQLPASVPVRIHNSAPLAAQVSFTAVMPSNRFANKTTQLNTVVPTAGEDEPANNAMLVVDTDYAVLVQPADPTLPPHSLHFTASTDATLDVDYRDVQWKTRIFAVHNAPAGVYNIRARGKDGGALLSNSALIGFGGVVTLTFDSSDTPYELELIPVEQALYSTKGGSDCATASPKPTLTVDAAMLADKGFRDQLTVELPKLPDPISYAGTVKLCQNQKSTSNVPISLKTTSLIFPVSSNMVTGRFETASMATWDSDGQQYTFCARVLPGDYTVVATPPANVSCEIFAEHRLLMAPSPSSTADDDAQSNADLLELRTPATLAGTIQTPDMMPMANASIDLVALGKSTIMLAKDDRTVPLYNRSRQITSAATGDFTVPVDLGAYDVIVKPPVQSNFAWRILYGVEVGSRTAQFTTLITLTAPVVVSGALRYMTGTDRDQSSLASAEVHAYTLVDQDKPTERSVEIARGQADASGQVTLLMPPQLQKSWNP